MLNFNNWVHFKPKTLYEINDYELIEIIADFTNLPAYHIYNMACKIVNISNQEMIDKSYEEFYFVSGRLLPQIRRELRRAYTILKK
jgi:hypothetical protein